jgi:hypothetical protein
MNVKETAIKTRDFIRRLQRSDDKTKKMYVYSASALLMIVIIGLWLFYLNAILPQTTPPNANSTALVAPAESGAAETSPSIWSTFGRGLNLVWEDLGGAMGNIGNTVSGAWQEFQKQIQRTNTMRLEATSTTQ